MNTAQCSRHQRQFYIENNDLLLWTLLYTTWSGNLCCLEDIVDQALQQILLCNTFHKRKEIRFSGFTRNYSECLRNTMGTSVTKSKNSKAPPVIWSLMSGIFKETKFVTEKSNFALIHILQVTHRIFSLRSSNGSPQSRN